MPFSILFVCYENICRSPMAEGIFREAVRRRGVGGIYAVESAGTACMQKGSPPDDRAVEAVRALGIDIADQRARCTRDLELGAYSRIFVMDHDNYDELLLHLDESVPASVEMVADYLADPDVVAIDDPYYGSQEDFARVCSMLCEAVENICEEMLRQDFSGEGYRGRTSR